MKKVNNVLLILAIICSVMAVSSCRNAAKYADDVVKIVDDKADDAAKNYKPKPRRRTCSDCGGRGSVYNSYYNCYQECQGCGGDGIVVMNEDVIF